MIAHPPALAPRDAIRDVLVRRPHGLTARLVTGALLADDYRWPTRNRDQYRWPSYERVDATLRAMLRDGLVTRVQGPDGWVWRVADVGGVGVAALPGRGGSE